MNVLFVSWDGADGGYLSGLYFPLFSRLAQRGIRVHSLQFSWATADRTRLIAARARELGLSYQVVKVDPGSGGMSALKTMPRASWMIRQLLAEERFDAVMPRSLIPGTMCVLAQTLGRSTVPVVFDADGMMHEERVDFHGLSRRSPAYWGLRYAEEVIARGSASSIVRSSAAAQILGERSGRDPNTIHVAYNGRSTTYYHPRDADLRRSERHFLGVPEDVPLVVYVGSLGAKYGADEMVHVLSHLLELPERPHVRIFAQPSGERDRLTEPLRRFGDRVQCAYLTEQRLAEVLPSADCGLAMITPALSTLGVFPVKVAEYCLCGVPVITTAGVGDLSSIALEYPDALFATTSALDMDGITEWFRDVCIRRRDASRSAVRVLGTSLFGLDSMATTFETAIRESQRPR